MRIFLVLLAVATTAWADERFDKLDFDKDGRLSKAEAAGNADLITGFDKADRNRDGKLSPAEYDALLDGTAGKSAAAGSTSPKAKRKKKKD